MPPQVETLACSDVCQAPNREPQYTLMDQPMEVSSLAEANLVFESGLCFGGRPGQAIDVAQLETSWAVHIVLEDALAELKVLGQRHFLILPRRPARQ